MTGHIFIKNLKTQKVIFQYFKIKSHDTPVGKPTNFNYFKIVSGDKNYSNKLCYVLPLQYVSTCLKGVEFRSRKAQ